MAPRAGFEPATYWLTASCSTAELPRNILHIVKYITLLYPRNVIREFTENYDANCDNYHVFEYLKAFHVFSIPVIRAGVGIFLDLFSRPVRLPGPIALYTVFLLRPLHMAPLGYLLSRRHRDVGVGQC